MLTFFLRNDYIRVFRFDKECTLFKSFFLILLLLLDVVFHPNINSTLRLLTLEELRKVCEVSLVQKSMLIIPLVLMTISIFHVSTLNFIIVNQFIFAYETFERKVEVHSELELRVD
jgi:hypothetical protein